MSMVRPVRAVLRVLLAIVLTGLAAGAVFLVLLHWRPADTSGRAFLHLYYKSPAMALIPLPSGWIARYGVDRHEQCAILIDAARVPRFMACTFGGGADNPAYRGEPVDAATRARKAAERRRDPGEQVSSDVRETASGPIYHVERVRASSASFHVVTSGQLVEHEFFRMVGRDLLHLRTYQDAFGRSRLDPLAWDFAQRATIVPAP